MRGTGERSSAREVKICKLGLRSREKEEGNHGGRHVERVGCQGKPSSSCQRFLLWHRIEMLSVHQCQIHAHKAQGRNSSFSSGYQQELPLKYHLKYLMTGISFLSRVSIQASVMVLSSCMFSINSCFCFYLDWACVKDNFRANCSPNIRSHTCMGTMCLKMRGWSILEAFSMTGRLKCYRDLFHRGQVT